MGLKGGPQLVAIGSLEPGIAVAIAAQSDGTGEPVGKRMCEAEPRRSQVSGEQRRRHHQRDEHQQGKPLHCRLTVLVARRPHGSSLRGELQPVCALGAENANRSLRRSAC